jgi:rhodanese-related sulfurtransferase
MDISVRELHDRLSDGENLNLIDVREEYEYEDDNLGGRLIPLAELPSRVDELADLMNQEVLVHCRSGARSDRAKQYLLGQGFTNVRNVLGGIMAYRQLEEDEDY